MIGTISIECNAKNPNMPLHPLRAYINSPSSLRITNVPRKIGKWNINKVTIVAIYPDSTSQTAECVLTGGVWVGTIEGSTTAGTLTQGYTILADGVDENGNDVTGYVLGKGDVVIMKADGVPEPEPATIFVKLQDDGTGAEDGDIYPTENGYMIQQNGEAHQLGTPFDQITAYVDSQVSSKAEISSVEELANSLSDYYTKSETSSNVELDVKFETKADLSAIPTKTSELSNDSGFITSADIHNDYIEDINGSSISADRSFVTVTQLSGVWQLQYGVTTNTLHGQSKTNMSYFPTEPALGDNGFQLTWGIHSSEYWTLEVYTYNSSWSQTGQYDSEAATSAATELVFPNTSVQECIYEEPRIIETGKLATQEWVQAKISAKADLSALSTKADLSALDNYYTKSETSSAIEITNALDTKRDLNDMTVKGIPPNSQQSRFNITDGTITNNAYYYDEGRWESGQTFAVYATLTADVYELKKYDTSEWVSVGTFSLDNNYEATITNDGITYSIIGYAGDLVVNTELSSYATKSWVMEQLAALSVMLQGDN